MGKGRGGMLAQVAELKAYKFAVQHGKAAFQYGFIPLIIIIGMVRTGGARGGRRGSDAPD